MEFKEFNLKLQQQFKKMCDTGKLFKSNISGQLVWDTYLASFEPENNKRFRDPQSSEHNCNHCKNFIRRYGNVLSINESGKIESIFSNVSNSGEYQKSAEVCDNLLVNSTIENVFFETYNELKYNVNYEKVTDKLTQFRLGIAFNQKLYTKEEADKFGVVNTTNVYTFNHFHVDLPKQFVDKSGKSIGAIEGIYRDKYSVFKRAMEEIPLDTLILVKDLINQGSLLDGQTHLHIINSYINFHSIKPKNNINNWYWVITYEMQESIAKFKNTLIGTLCSELSEGVELNEACKNWNKRVDPVNYNKAKAPITQAQINLAKKFVEENGYIESFNRRLATIDDIKASEILHKNSDNAKEKPVTIFDNIKTPSGNGRYKRSEFDKIEEVTIDKFMSDILPTATNVELFLENTMEGNLVNLTTIVNEEAKQIFKWDNPFSYTFNGNLAGKSQIKENVKSAGGKIDGILRCSLQWNDSDTPGNVDFDLHCKENTHHIYYSNKKSPFTGGWLDVDMIRPTKVGIENITWQNKLPDGKYEFFVKNFDGGSNTGFKVEIEFEGNVFNYYYTLSPGYRQDVKIATVSVVNGVISIKHHLPETSTSKDLWSLPTNEFHKVNLVCLTPNHWGDNSVGNKHYLFMLQGCKNSNQVRGFHNEHLIPDLLQHRKVLDVLGNNAMIEPTDNQLAGVGFNATVKDSVILRISGSFKRVIKVII